MSEKSKTYQELAAELDELINKLQSDNCSIEEALKLYEQGIALTNKLTDYLINAENQLKKIAQAPGKQ